MNARTSIAALSLVTLASCATSGDVSPLIAGEHQEARLALQTGDTDLTPPRWQREEGEEELLPTVTVQTRFLALEPDLAELLDTLFAMAQRLGLDLDFHVDETLDPSATSLVAIADAALRAITLSAAEILGVDDQLGSLEEGKSATLFVSEGDVMDLLTQKVTLTPPLAVPVVTKEATPLLLVTAVTPVSTMSPPKLPVTV